MQLDILFLAAHPDDAELFCGGTIIKMRELGYQVGILDLTRGESASAGTIADRDTETQQANTILKPAFRHNLGLPDSRLQDNDDARRLIVEIIRQYRVKLLVAPIGPCRHPDHTATWELARSVYFFSGAHKYPVDLPPWRPLKLIYHLEYHDRPPSFVIDVSAQFEAKMEAIRAYSTQFYNPANPQGLTEISQPHFMERMIARFRHYGHQIQCQYGEPFISEDIIRLDNPMHLITP